jgi:perosamine synthetase
LIPVNTPEITKEDIDSVVQSLKDGWISGEGPVISQFENSTAEAVGRSFAAAVSNGSDALDLAFMALDLRPGDEVILPSFAIISCLSPILRMGLVPVFVDVDDQTWNLDVTLLTSALTAKTKAILVVHTYGLAAEMNVILNFAREHGLWVIEDAAEAHGLFFQDRPCGSMGDISTFSFYANKNVTTGEGGMVLTDNPDLHDRVQYLRNLAFQPRRRFVHDDLGWNMRLSSIQAALGISQLKRIAQTVEKRRAIAEIYKEALTDLSDSINWQASSFMGQNNGYWVVGVTLKSQSGFANAQHLMTALAEEGVGSRPFFYPLHRQPLMTKFPNFRAVSSMQVSEWLGEMGVYLPNGLGLPLEKVYEAAEITHNVLTKGLTSR